MNLPPSLFDDKRIRDRLTKQYSDMTRRAKPRMWKRGKKQGTIRTPGIERLPFTKDQMVAYVLALLGTSVVKCPYCVAIGRPATLIDLSTFVLDHKVPIARGGSWELKNLIPVCADCNNCKGKLSYALFIGIMSEMEKWPDQADRTQFYSCLRSHGVSTRLRFGGKEEDKGQPKLPPPPKTASLDFDDFNGPTTPPLPRKDDF